MTETSPERHSVSDSATRNTILFGIAAQFVSLSVWQTGLIVQKLLVVQSNVATVMLLQLGCAALVMWAGLLLMRRMPAANRRTLVTIAWGLTAPGLVLLLGIMGAALTDGISIVLIWGAFPLVGPIVARLTIGEHLHRSFIAGGIIGFGGVVVLTLHRFEGGGTSFLGNMLILAAVVCASLNTVIGRVLNRAPGRWIEIATLQVTGAALGALVLTLFVGWSPPDFTQGETLVSILFLVLFMTIINFLAINLAYARIPVALISLNASVAPVMGIVAATILLGSPFGGYDLLSAVLILCGASLPHVMRFLRTSRFGTLSG